MLCCQYLNIEAPRWLNNLKYQSLALLTWICAHVVYRDIASVYTHIVYQKLLSFFKFLIQLLTDPVGSSKKMYQGTMRWVERQGVKWLWSSFSTKQMYWLAAAYILPMLTVSFIVSSVSTALFVGAMLAMVLSTIEIVMDSEKARFQADYLALLQCFNDSDDDGSLMTKLLSRSSTTKYANFVVALVVGLVSLKFSYIHPAFYSILFLAAVVAVMFVVLQYDLHEHSIFIYFCIAKIPGTVFTFLFVVSSCVSLPALSTFFEIFHRQLYVLSLSEDFSLYFDWVTLIQMAFHLWFLVTCFYKFKWSDLSRIAGPLCLLVCWFTVLKFFLLQSSTEYTFLIIGGFTAFTMIPIILVLVFAASPFVLFYVYRFTPPFFYSLGFVAGGLVLFTLLWTSWRYFPSFWLNLSLDYIFLMAVVLTVPCSIYLSAWYSSMYAVSSLPPVQMEEYAMYCSPEQKSMNFVQTQINCLHLQGRVLQGEGTVSKVAISNVLDKKASSLHFLPSTLQQALVCALGEKEPMCGNLRDASTCVPSGCHFHSTLQYTFELQMSLRLGQGQRTAVGAKMQVPDRYKELVLSLVKDSVIRFDASFVDGIGTDQLVLQARHVQADGFENDTGVGNSDRDKDKKEMIEKFIYTFMKSLQSIVIMVLDMLFGILH